jgi:hypothetical protein
MVRVLEVVEAEAIREDNIGWFDQYSKLIGDVNVKDIVVAVVDGFYFSRCLDLHAVELQSYFSGLTLGWTDWVE